MFTEFRYDNHMPAGEPHAIERGWAWEDCERLQII